MITGMTFPTPKKIPTANNCGEIISETYSRSHIGPTTSIFSPKIDSLI